MYRMIPHLTLNIYTTKHIHRILKLFKINIKYRILHYSVTFHIIKCLSLSKKNIKNQMLYFLLRQFFKNMLLDWTPTISQFSIANVHIHLKIAITSLPISDAHVVN